MFVTNIKFCFYNTTGEFNFMLYCIYFYIFTYYIQDQPLKVLETGNSFIDVILNKRGTLINLMAMSTYDGTILNWNSTEFQPKRY